jgi:integrase
MMIDAVQEYLKVRRACGYELNIAGWQLRSFAGYSDARGRSFLCSQTAIEWAGLGRTNVVRARRLDDVIRFVRFIHAEDDRHEIPVQVFGRLKDPRPVPYIFTREALQRLLTAASNLPTRPPRQQTYRTFFALLACTGLRVSEAIRLRQSDITADGLLIRNTKFRKSRLVPLHDTAYAALEHYLRRRRPADSPSDDHVFISSAGKSLRVDSTEEHFEMAVRRAGLPGPKMRPHPNLYSLRHTFAVRALLTCPDGRDHVTQHMLALSTYMGHSDVTHTYWYLEATPDLMANIAGRCEDFLDGALP